VVVWQARYHVERRGHLWWRRDPSCRVERPRSTCGDSGERSRVSAYDLPMVMGYKVL
jgi:hypothetical protein